MVHPGEPSGIHLLAILGTASLLHRQGLMIRDSFLRVEKPHVLDSLARSFQRILPDPNFFFSLEFLFVIMM